MSESEVPPPSVDTLYYDGMCSLCAREIDELKLHRKGSLNFVDIHSLSTSGDDAAPSVSDDNQTYRSGEQQLVDATSVAQPDKDALLRTLHLRRADGTWVRGADANVAAWEGTKSEALWRVLRLPVIRNVVDVFYGWWATWRYRRLYGRQFDEQRHAP